MNAQTLLVIVVVGLVLLIVFEGSRPLHLGGPMTLLLLVALFIVAIGRL